MSIKELSHQQKRFVGLYLKDNRFNQTAAYMEAYHQDDEDIAASNASALVRNRKIMKAIDSILNQRFKRLNLKPEIVLQEIIRVALGDVRQLYNDNGSLKDMQEINIAQQAMIKSVETKESITSGFVIEKKIKCHDKLKALELLARNLKILGDVGGLSPGVNVNVNVYPQKTIVFQDVKPNGDNQSTDRMINEMVNRKDI